jgi:pimeloyl-ACP methyl ester carboxylesterase
LKFKLLIITVISVTLLAVVTAFHYFDENVESFEESQAKSKEKFLVTKLGVTRYQIYGNQEDPTIVFVHSFNGFIESWAPNIKPLVNAGYRVVVYDLWGRGLSDRPRIELNIQIFREQLEQIVNFVGAESLHLVGSSFGSVIAADFAQQHPDQVEKLILIGPAGWPSDNDTASVLLDIPVIGDVIFHYFGQHILKSKVVDYFIHPEEHSNTLVRWEEFAEYPGFTRSALSTLRYAPVLDYTEGWKELGESELPVLFIWGKEDVSFPFSNAEKAKKLIPHAKIIGLEQAAHWVNIEQPEKTNAAILSFLSSDGEMNLTRVFKPDS